MLRTDQGWIAQVPDGDRFYARAAPIFYRHKLSCGACKRSQPVSGLAQPLPKFSHPFSFFITWYRFVIAPSRRCRIPACGLYPTYGVGETECNPGPKGVAQVSTGSRSRARCACGFRLMGGRALLRRPHEMPGPPQAPPLASAVAKTRRVSYSLTLSPNQTCQREAPAHERVPEVLYRRRMG